jgi:hypothetical protein
MTNNNDKHLAQVFHFDLYGKREEKYSFLLKNDLQSIKWAELQPEAPNYFFVQKDFSLKEEYKKGFKIDELFIKQSMGVTSGNDTEFIAFSRETLIEKFSLANIKKIDYRVFDYRHMGRCYIFG